MRARGLALIAVCVGLLAAPAAAQDGTTDSTATDGRYREFGDAGGFLNILPPGQDGTLSSAELAQVSAAVAAEDPAAFPPHYGDQWGPYTSLVQGAPDLTPETLGNYFKDASFGVPEAEIARTYSPGGNADVTVVRDTSWGVPHIFGRTRYATMYAEGYTTAEDRLVFLDVLRHVGRGTLSELIGIDGIGQDNVTLATAPYTEEDFERQIDELEQLGPDGAAVVEDLTAYADGINALIAEVNADPAKLPAEYALLGRKPEPWKPTDTVAVAANVGGIFGKGGGRELTNYCGIQELAASAGDARSRELFDLLHFAEDLAAPTTSSDPAPYMADLGEPDPDATPAVDCTSLQSIGGDSGPAEGGLGGGDGLALPPSIATALASLTDSRAASNAVLIAGKHTDTGRPIAVFGPQVGYNAPALLVEKDVHGPGIDARGVAFAGTDAYVQLGRGRDYAWSATSAGADNIDTFVLELCDPAGGPAAVTSTGYRHDGECIAIETFDHVVTSRRSLLPTSEPVTLTWKIERAPDYGPIRSRGTLTDGTPVAIAERRSTYGGELTSAVGFKRLNDPGYMEGGVNAFRRAASEGIDYTFNWFYVDAADIGYQHSCKCPLRAEGVDPDLPVRGTGEWDWQGFLAPTDQPHAVNPDAGYLVSWNNKQAPQFRASDAEFQYGPAHRAHLLISRVEEAIETGKVDRVAAVKLVMDAATADIRGEVLLPQLLKVLSGAPPPGTDERVLNVREKLEVWADQGAYRRDLDGDGAYDDPFGPALMDTWFDVLGRNTYATATSGAIEALELPVDDSPRGHGGSSWLDGLYSLVRRDLDLLDAQESGDDAGAEPLCGADRDACAATLWASLAEAVRVLEAAAPPSGYAASDSFGTPTVESWKRVPADDQIEYQTLAAQMIPMQWVNRPTFHQVVQLESGARSSHRRAAGDRSADDDGFPVVLVVLGVLGGVGIGLVISLVVRRRRSAGA